MFWAVVMFGFVMVAFTVLGKTWIEHQKPRQADPDEVPLASLDGFALCRDCKHPLPKPRVKTHPITLRTTVTWSTDEQP